MTKNCCKYNSDRIYTEGVLYKIKTNIVNLLMENENIFKLLWYVDWKIDPLKQDISDEIISDIVTQFTPTHELNPNCRIFATSFVGTTEDRQIAQLRIYPKKIYANGKHFADYYINIDVIVHNSVEYYHGGHIRKEELVDLIIQTLNGKSTELIRDLELKGVDFADTKGGFDISTIVFRTEVGSTGIC